ncbi:hypothetical protein GXW78_18160 [Roseomonas terrae]|uniref:Uncharacterized protein n=1 Tax=Neoroseomonas terrae TaxID=424799 RepID=A0ABS5EKP6_9PROT|nr:hypothetical protein [Neoroseomonas terrae]MBR0651600.1 hypothetical protein [Neoroseomonas terrae]
MPNAPPLEDVIALAGLVPFDQQRAIAAQQFIADATLIHVLARLPHPRPYASPSVKVIPNGYWRSEHSLGFTEAPTLTVILPAAGSAADAGPAKTHGISPRQFAAILLHEIVHLIEFSRTGSAELVRDDLDRYPDDASRPSYRAAIGGASRTLFNRPLDTAKDLNHWPEGQGPESVTLIRTIADHVRAELAPPARIEVDAAGNLRRINLWRSVA